MTATLYSAQISRPALQRWARRTPREIGAALIGEALAELVAGDAGPMKSLPFISRLNKRRARRRKAQA